MDELLEKYGLMLYENKHLMALSILLLITYGMFLNTYGCQWTEPRSNITLYGNCQDIINLTKYNYLQWLDQGTLIFEEPIPINTIHIPINTTTTQTTTTHIGTTTTTMFNCPECTPCICTCEICPKCPSPQFERTQEEINYLLNDCQIKDGSTCYQSGSADTCDKIREALDIPGRPKFKTRPSIGYNVLQTQEEDTYCFKNLGGYFLVNRSTRTFNNSNNDLIERKMWGWNDENCLSSVLRINKL